MPEDEAKDSEHPNSPGDDAQAVAMYAYAAIHSHLTLDTPVEEGDQILQLAERVRLTILEYSRSASGQPVPRVPKEEIPSYLHTPPTAVPEPPEGVPDSESKMAEGHIRTNARPSSSPGKGETPPRPRAWPAQRLLVWRVESPGRLTKLIGVRLEREAKGKDGAYLGPMAQVLASGEACDGLPWGCWDGDAEGAGELDRGDRTALDYRPD